MENDNDEYVEPALLRVQEALKHVPEHDRTSCSDENICNGYTTPGRGGYPRCKRCALLKAEKDFSYRNTLFVQIVTEVRVSLPSED